jgi:probable phosphoglycerate mutase
MKTTILLVRHGETESTHTDRFNGRTDISLNARGVEQVRHLAASLATENIAACYCSPLSRCVETARLIIANRPVEIEPHAELIEGDYGSWELLSRDEIRARYSSEWQRWSEDPASVAPPGGESGYQVAVRVISFFNDVMLKWSGRTILIVGHKTVNRILLAHWLDIPIKNYRRKLAQYPSALNRIELSDGGMAQVVLLNDTSHIADDRSQE